jgi:hypothetical protein
LDELIDAEKLRSEWKKKNPEHEVQFLDRPGQIWGPSNHHILFHSKYFPERKWDEFVSKIETFLKAPVYFRSPI